MKTGVPLGTTVLISSLVRPERLRRRSATAAPRWGRCRCAPLPHANRQRPTTLRVVVDLPTFWFVGRREFCRLLLNQRVRRPVLTLHSAESRQVTPSADSTLRYRARRVSAFDRSWSRKAAVGCADEELSLAGRQLRSTRGTDFVFPNHLGWVWHDGQAGVCGRCCAARAISDRA